MKSIVIRVLKWTAEKLGLIVLDPKECVVGSNMQWAIGEDHRYGTTVEVRLLIEKNLAIPTGAVQAKRILIARLS